MTAMSHFPPQSGDQSPRRGRSARIRCPTQQTEANASRVLVAVRCRDSQPAHSMPCWAVPDTTAHEIENLTHLLKCRIRNRTDTPLDKRPCSERNRHRMSTLSSRSRFPIEMAPELPHPNRRHRHLLWRVTQRSVATIHRQVADSVDLDLVNVNGRIVFRRAGLQAGGLHHEGQWQRSASVHHQRPPWLWLGIWPNGHPSAPNGR